MAQTSVVPAPTAAPPAVALTASEIADAIEAKYYDYGDYGPGDRWLVMREVPTATGFGTGNDDLSAIRRIDVLCHSLWHTDGHKRVAWEIKVDRADWLAELAHPIKRAQIHYLTDEAWFALAPGVFRQEDVEGGSVDEAVSKVDRLMGWGIVVFSPEGTNRVIRGATKREAHPIPDSHAAALLRAAYFAGVRDCMSRLPQQ